MQHDPEVYRLLQFLPPPAAAGGSYTHGSIRLTQGSLRERGVRLIAVAEGIDTAKGEDDFMPFRNIFAEWHARDTSRKIRAILGARTAAGKHVTGALPYGYLHGPDDRQKWRLHITTIKLNNLHLTECITMEVSDGIIVTLSIGGRLCDSYKRRKRK